MVLALGAEKVFVCQAHAEVLYWRVNGTSVLEVADEDETITASEVDHLGGGIVQQNLTMIATSENNNTHLECITVSSSLTLETERDINVKIQGKYG